MTAISEQNQTMSGEPDKQSGHDAKGQPQRLPLATEYQQREKQQQQQRNQQRPLLQQHEQQQQ